MSYHLVKTSCIKVINTRFLQLKSIALIPLKPLFSKGNFVIFSPLTTSFLNKIETPAQSTRSSLTEPMPHRQTPHTDRHTRYTNTEWGYVLPLATATCHCHLPTIRHFLTLPSKTRKKSFHIIVTHAIHCFHSMPGEMIKNNLTGEENPKPTDMKEINKKVRHSHETPSQPK